ncbi:MAG: hypothetical protein WBB45_15480 [Cyclobacteriaceae bacterium]
MESKFIPLFFLLLISCNDSKYQYKYEAYIDSVYSHPFNSDGFAPDVTDPKKLYDEFESMLINSSYLNSVSREDYFTLIEKLVNDSVNLDDNRISEKFGERSFYFESASYSYLSFDVYNHASKKFHKEGDIVDVNNALQNTRNGADLKDNIRLIKNYIYSIKEDDFRNKIIYRIPILSQMYLYGVQ